MSFPIREAVDVDMFTGVGSGSFACFNRGAGDCPWRGGHCCIAFVEVMCCTDGTHTATLLGIIAYDSAGVGDKLTEKPDGDPWQGSYWMPYALAVSLGQPSPYGWADQTQPISGGRQEYNHRMAPASVLPVALAELPGLPEDDTTPPPTPAHVTLPVTDPTTLPAGCTLSYVAISSKEWIDVIQSDGAGGYKTNCGMGCKQAGPPE